MFSTSLEQGRGSAERWIGCLAPQDVNNHRYAGEQSPECLKERDFVPKSVKSEITHKVVRITLKIPAREARRGIPRAKRAGKFPGARSAQKELGRNATFSYQVPNKTPPLQT